MQSLIYSWRMDVKTITVITKETFVHSFTHNWPYYSPTYNLPASVLACICFTGPEINHQLKQT